MVLPPGRIGGARGPNGSTLDDIVDAINGTNTILNELAVTLSSQNEFLDSIANDLSYIVGSPGARPAWPGLVLWLNTVLGDADFPASPWPLSVDVSITREVLGRLSQYLGGVNLQSASITRGKGLLEVLGAQVGDVATEPGSYVRDLAAVAGLLADAPAGETLKSLLAATRDATERSADCCEGGGENPPDPNQTQPCETDGTSFRVTSYEFWRNLPADGFDEYILVFNGIDAASSGDVITQSSTNTPPLTALATTVNTILLVESNLLSGQVPSQVARYLSGTDNNFSTSTGAIFTPGIGCGATTSIELDSDEGLAMWTIRIPQGQAAPAHKNYWLNFAPVPV